MRVEGVIYRVSLPSALPFSLTQATQKVGETGTTVIIATPNVPISSNASEPTEINNVFYLEIASTSNGLDLSAATVSRPGVTIFGVPTVNSLILRVTLYSDSSQLSVPIIGTVNPVCLSIINSRGLYHLP